MQISLIIIFRNRVQEYVYSFDIMAVDEKLNSSLVGYSIVNTATGNVSMSICEQLDLGYNQKSDLMDESLQIAKRIEENIFASR